MKGSVFPQEWANCSESRLLLAKLGFPGLLSWCMILLALPRVLLLFFHEAVILTWPNTSFLYWENVNLICDTIQISQGKLGSPWVMSTQDLILRSAELCSQVILPRGRNPPSLAHIPGSQMVGLTTSLSLRFWTVQFRPLVVISIPAPELEKKLFRAEHAFNEFPPISTPPPEPPCWRNKSSQGSSCHGDTLDTVIISYYPLMSLIQSKRNSQVRSSATLNTNSLFPTPKPRGCSMCESHYHVNVWERKRGTRVTKEPWM